jgi:DNA polymerase-1
MLAQVGIVPARWTDTMLMANLLGDLPKGLKALAFRLAHMGMTSYSDLVDPITTERAIRYLAKVAQFTWPKPDKIKVLEDGEYRWKQPWSAHTMAKSILNSVAKGTCDDPYKRWHEYPSRSVVEDVLGKLRAASIADAPFDKAVYYACRDADAALRVYHHLNPRIQANNQQKVLDRDCGVVPMVVDMERHGMEVDRPHFEQLGEDYEQRKWVVVEKIKDLVGYKVNPGSSDQVRDLLFKRLGLNPKWRTKDGADSTNAAALEALEDAHPVVPLITEYRELDKMQGTFVKGVLDNSARWTDERCRTHLLMITASTGRFAAKEPNLLAFPQEDRSAEGKPLRDGFVAGEGKVFVSGDYSQIELRVLAHMSQEPTMLEVFRNGGDIHRETAAEVFKVPADLVTPAQRAAVKKVNFGIPYGITDIGLFKFLESDGWTRKACEQLINNWFSRFSNVAGFMNGVRTFARRHRYVEDMFGRRRLIPEVLSAHQFVREAGLRQAGNQPIQTGANSILKESMVRLTPVYKQLQREGHYIWPLLPIHDDLLWVMDEAVVSWVIPLIKSIMEGCVTLSVPIVVDFKVGKRWGSMVKYETATG